MRWDLRNTSTIKFGIKSLQLFKDCNKLRSEIQILESVIEEERREEEREDLLNLMKEGEKNLEKN